LNTGKIKECRSKSDKLIFTVNQVLTLKSLPSNTLKFAKQVPHNSGSYQNIDLIVFLHLTEQLV